MNKEKYIKYLNYIADYILTRQYSLRTINAYLSWVQTLFTFTTNSIQAQWEIQKSKRF